MPDVLCLNRLYFPVNQKHHSFSSLSGVRPALSRPPNISSDYENLEFIVGCEEFHSVRARGGRSNTNSLPLFIC